MMYSWSFQPVSDYLLRFIAHCYLSLSIMSMSIKVNCSSPGEVSFLPDHVFSIRSWLLIPANSQQFSLVLVVLLTLLTLSQPEAAASVLFHHSSHDHDHLGCRCHWCHSRHPQLCHHSSVIIWELSTEWLDSSVSIKHFRSTFKNISLLESYRHFLTIKFNLHTCTIGVKNNISFYSKPPTSSQHQNEKLRLRHLDIWKPRRYEQKLWSQLLQRDDTDMVTYKI